MIKLNGYFIAISVLVVLASSETFDNRTTPHNDRITSQNNPQLQEGTTTTIRFLNEVTPGKSTSKAPVAEGVTPPRSTQVSPARQDQTPSKATTTTSRPPTPSRSPSPDRLVSTPAGATSRSRPPTPSAANTRPPTPTRQSSPGQLSMRTTPAPIVSQTGGSSSSSMRTTPAGSTSRRTTPANILSGTSTLPTSSTEFFPPPSSTSGPSTGSTGITTSLGSTPGVESPSTPGPSSSMTPEITSSIGTSFSSPGVETSTPTPTPSPSPSQSSSASSPTPSPTESTASSTPSTASSTASASASTASSPTPSPSPSPSSSPSPSPSPSSSPTPSTESSTPSTVTTSPTPSSTPSPTQSTVTSTPSTPSSTPSTPPSTPSSPPSTPSSPPTPSTTLPNGGGQIIHTQIMFCQKYGDYDLPPDPITMQDYLKDLQNSIATASGVVPDRIKNLYLVRDPDTGNTIVQFDVVPGPGSSTDQVVINISDKVKQGNFKVMDKFQNEFNVQCNLPIYPMCPWTDYGNCADKKCMNGGRCNVAVTCHYYCECPPGWSGRYCEEKPAVEKKKDNLWLLWLLITPLAILALLALLCCFCCWQRCCCWGAAAAAPQQKIQIIEEDIYDDACSQAGTVRSCRSACSARPSSIYAYTPSCGPQSCNDAGSTYYHALGRPFAVAFSDNTFSAVGYASNDMGIYNSCGKRVLPAASCCGEDEIEVIMNKPRRGSFCGSAISGGSGYHSALGNRYAVAYNDRAFNTYSSIPRHGSVRYYN